MTPKIKIVGKKIAHLDRFEGSFLTISGSKSGFLAFSYFYIFGSIT